MPSPAPHALRTVASFADPELAALAAGGDEAAFRLIMERNNGRLYRVARGVVANDGEAEDIVQEAYVRAFTKLHTFRAEATLSTWLTRIVLNEAFGRLRRQQARPELSTPESEADQLRAEIIPFPGAATNDDPERAAARRDIAGVLERAIDALPEAFRPVFVMRAIEEMSVEECAAALVCRRRP